MAYTYQQIDSNGELTSHPTTALPTVGTASTGWSVPGVVGNDVNGAVSSTTTAAQAAGTVVTVTFGTVYAKPPVVVVTGPLGAYATSVTSTGFTVSTSITAVTTTAYLFNYVVSA
jgi:hypothetical protein